MGVDVCVFKGLGETARGRRVPLRKVYVAMRKGDFIFYCLRFFFGASPSPSLGSFVVYIVVSASWSLGIY